MLSNEYLLCVWHTRSSIKLISITKQVLCLSHTVFWNCLSVSVHILVNKVITNKVCCCWQEFSKNLVLKISRCEIEIHPFSEFLKGPVFLLCNYLRAAFCWPGWEKQACGSQTDKKVSMSTPHCDPLLTSCALKTSLPFLRF